MRKLLLALLLMSSGCGSGAETRRATFISGTYRLVLRVEVADTPAERAGGLMGRRVVRAGTGMLFDYHGVPTTAGYWMKGTLVALDVAFVRKGHVVEIDQMIPCDADPCPLTVPDQPYDQAIEARHGTFSGAHVEVGATVQIQPS